MTHASEEVDACAHVLSGLFLHRGNQGNVIGTGSIPWSQRGSRPHAGVQDCGMSQ
uniref:ABC transporter ATP-binding protein n=1 Tax=Mesocestoides corti TaxID=53468 RepID=A0A5K3FJZ6_MESCO